MIHANRLWELYVAITLISHQKLDSDSGGIEVHVPSWKCADTSKFWGQKTYLSELLYYNMKLSFDMLHSLNVKCHNATYISYLIKGSMKLLLCPSWFCTESSICCNGTVKHLLWRRVFHKNIVRDYVMMRCLLIPYWLITR